MSLMGEVTGSKRASSPRLLRQFGCDGAPRRRVDMIFSHRLSSSAQ
jgi:hypothetical protein